MTVLAEKKRKNVCLQDFQMQIILMVIRYFCLMRMVLLDKLESHFLHVL